MITTISYLIHNEFIPPSFFRTTDNIIYIYDCNGVQANNVDGISSPGILVMHEITEGYEGAKISLETGIEATPAINTDKVNNLIYNEAHEKAYHQPQIISKEGRYMTEYYYKTFQNTIIP